MNDQKKIAQNKSCENAYNYQQCKVIRRVARNLQRGAALGVWGPSPQRLKILRFFKKKLNFSAILIKNNAFKTWHRNW